MNSQRASRLATADHLPAASCSVVICGGCMMTGDRMASSTESIMKWLPNATPNARAMPTSMPIATMGGANVRRIVRRAIGKLRLNTTGSDINCSGRDFAWGYPARRPESNHP